MAKAVSVAQEILPNRMPSVMTTLLTPWVANWPRSHALAAFSSSSVPGISVIGTSITAS